MATLFENPKDESLKLSWGWLLTTGIVYLILGVIALSIPITSTLGLTFALATLLLVGGIVHLFHSIKLRNNRGGALRYFQSAVAIIAGGLMYRYPGGGILGLALVLSFYFFLNAAVQWLLFSVMRPLPGWGWGIASSIVSFLLGVYIIMAFPFSAFWVPGTLLGIELIFTGSGLIAFSFSSRKPSSTENKSFNSSQTMESL